MLDVTRSLPEDPAEPRAFTALLLAEVESQAVLIEKLRHQLAGRRAHRFGASSETSEQLQSALETTEIAIAAMTAKRHPPEDVQADKPKRRPVPDRIPRLKVEPTPAGAECAQCGGKLRRLGKDATEEREYVPGPSPPPLGLNQWRTNGGSSNQWRTMARYRFSSDRKRQHPKDHLSKHAGWMHADGYAGFEDLYRSGHIREVACLAARHCPRTNGGQRLAPTQVCGRP